MAAEALGGVWNDAVDLCSALSRMGVEMILATRGRAMNPRQARTVAQKPGIVVEEGESVG